SAIICLADDQKFNFSMYIFYNMVKSLEGVVKFYLFPRFLQVFLGKQVEGMARHKEMYVISSHTKKIFANIRRIRAGCSRVITPLFDSIMVQAAADMGDTLVESHQTSIVNQPSTSKPQKPQNPRRKQRKDAETSHDESANEDHVPTPFSDPLPSEIALDDETQGRTNDDEMLQAREREEFSEVQKSRLLVELIEKRKKHVAALRAQKKRGKPPTKTQMKSQIEMTKVNNFIAVDSEAQESSTKRIAEHLESDISKKQKVDENVEPVVDDSEELRKCIEIVPDDGDEVLIKATPISSRSPTIIDYKIHKEGKKTYLKIIIADDGIRLQAREREEFSEVQKSRLLVELIEKRKKHVAALRAQKKRGKPPTKTQMKSQIEMTKVNNFIAVDSEAQESSTKRIAEHLESDISKKQKVDENVEPVVDDSEELRKCIEIVPDDGDEVLIKATPISSRSPTIIDYKIHKEGKKTYLKIIIADEKMYPLIRNTLHHLWSDVRVQVDYDVEMAYNLLRFIRKQLMEGYTPQ
nr:hypothetical protein [Tanacetum cinerariifolium]